MGQERNAGAVRPEWLTDEILEYFDELRESGRTNMWGASVYAEDELGLGSAQAKEALSYWMKTFGKGAR
jgi:hypothetical protein